MCGGGRRPGGEPFGGRRGIRGRGPHLIHVRREAEGEGHGADGFDLKKNDDAGAIRSVAGREHDLANCEIGVGVGEDGDVGMDLNPRSVLIDVDGDGIVLHLDGDAEVAADFPGKIHASKAPF